MKIKKEKIRIIIGCTLAVIILVVLVLAITNAISIKPKNCRFLSPLTLQKFSAATAVAPVYGEKCELNNKDYLIRLLYKDSREADLAKYGFEVNTNGQKQENTISFEGNSAVFLQDQEKLAIIIFIGKQEKQVASVLKKYNGKLLFNNFKLPSVDSAKIEKEFLPIDELTTETKEYPTDSSQTSTPFSQSLSPTQASSSKSGTLPSKWVYPGGDAYKGTIELKDDGTFTFTGLKSPDFISGGNYFFERNVVTLEFTKDLDYWQKVFADGSSFTSSYEDILEVKNGEKPSATFDVYKCGQINGNDCINFFNWLFYFE